MTRSNPAWKVQAPFTTGMQTCCTVLTTGQNKTSVVWGFESQARFEKRTSMTADIRYKATPHCRLCMFTAEEH